MVNNILEKGNFYISTADGDTFYLGSGTSTLTREERVVSEIPYEIRAHEPFKLSISIDFDTDRVIRQMLGMTEYQYRKANMTPNDFKHWKRCQNRKRK